MKLRSALYRTARRLGDVNAVRRGRVPQRLARRAAGRATSRLLRWLFPSVLALALALGLAACGGSGKPTNQASTPASSTTATSAPPTSVAPTTTTVPKVGATQISISDDGTYHSEGKITLLAYTGNAVLPQWRNDPLSNGTPKGFKYVAIELKIIITKSNYPDNDIISWQPWSLLNRNGETYQPATEWNNNVLVTPFYPDDKTIRVGQARKGWIPFLVPKSWHPDTVEYDNGTSNLTWDL